MEILGSPPFLFPSQIPQFFPTYLLLRRMKVMRNPVFLRKTTPKGLLVLSALQCLHIIVKLLCIVSIRLRVSSALPFI